MSDKAKNPSAFPRSYGDVYNAEAGMTLRDYFAAAALQGLWSGNSSALAPAARERKMPVLDHTANAAYEMADAMLNARNTV